MTFDEFQTQAMTTAEYPQVGNNLNYAIVGLMGEAGELLNQWQKRLRGDFDDDEAQRALSKELFGVCWFVAAVASELDLSMDSIATLGLEMLKDRAARNKIKGSGDDR
jgi:NTP pyrophosphatase (non-canonical NTP hydrolase)